MPQLNCETIPGGPFVHDGQMWEHPDNVDVMPCGISLEIGIIARSAKGYAWAAHVSPFSVSTLRLWRACKTVCPLRSGGPPPILRLQGLLGAAEPILAAGGRAVRHCRGVFVGIDVSKARNAIAVADDGTGPHDVEGEPEVMRALTTLSSDDILTRKLMAKS